MAEFKIRRKLFRMVGLLFPAVYAAGDAVAPPAGWVAATAILVLFLCSMVALELVRFRRPGVNRWLFEHFRGFTKEKERQRTSSTTLFLLSCLMTILLFGRLVAIASILMLVFGDPVAEWVGTRFGRVRLLGKTLEGTAGGFVACLLAAAPVALMSSMTAAVLIAGAAAASLCELLPLPVDDNFTIPLGAGLAMTLAQAAWPDAGGVSWSPLVQAIASMMTR
jgi:acyl phosphate:glycerol-3-phosphate acyltransferase